MKFFCKCIRGIFTSPLTYIAAVLFAVLCAAGVTVDINRDTYSFFEIIANKKLFDTARASSQCASYLIAIRFTQSSWYPIGLAVLTAIPALYTYIRSLEKIDRFCLIRLNFKTYSAGVILSSFLSGLMIVIVGLIIYFGASYLLFPSLASFNDPVYEIIYGDTSQKLFSMLKLMLNHAFVGGVIPVFAITLYRFIHSDFLAATIPMMLMYVSIKLIPNYREWFSSDIQRLENPFAKLMIFLFPSAMTGLGDTLEYSFNAPFWLAYIFFGSLVFAMYLLFYRSIRRV